MTAGGTHAIHRACRCPIGGASRRFVVIGNEEDPFVPGHLRSAVWIQVSNKAQHRPPSKSSRVPEQEIAGHQHVRNVQLVPFLTRREGLSQYRWLNSFFVDLLSFVLLCNAFLEVDDTLDFLGVDGS